MQRQVVKKVRLTAQEAKTLRRLAQIRNTTESEVLREAIQRLSIIEARKNAVEKLIALAGPETDWTKPRYEGKA